MTLEHTDRLSSDSGERELNDLLKAPLVEFRGLVPFRKYIKDNGVHRFSSTRREPYDYSSLLVVREDPDSVGQQNKILCLDRVLTSDEWKIIYKRNSDSMRLYKKLKNEYRKSQKVK